MTWGGRDCPLSYVIRENVTPPDEAEDPLEQGLPYGSAGSIILERVARLNHAGALYKHDNAKVHEMLENATRGTPYAPTIKPSSRAKDGRAAYLAIVSSHAGKDKFEQLHKEKLKFLADTKWNGRQYALEKFTSQHRSAYTILEECHDHVDFQLPTTHTRVGYLLDNIVNSDPDLRAALANIRINMNGMRSDFEGAVAHLLPVCPYTKHQNEKGGTKPKAQISDVTLKGAHDSRTGVDLRWYKHSEYKKLSKEQKDELSEWQRSNEGRASIKAQRDKAKNGKEGGKGAKKNSRAALKAKIKALEAKVDDKTDTADLNSEIESSIAAVLASSTPAAPAAAPAAAIAATPPSAAQLQSKAVAYAVQGILKRRKIG